MFPIISSRAFVCSEKGRFRSARVHGTLEETARGRRAIPCAPAATYDFSTEVCALQPFSMRLGWGWGWDGSEAGGRIFISRKALLLRVFLAPCHTASVSGALLFFASSASGCLSGSSLVNYGGTVGENPMGDVVPPHCAPKLSVNTNIYFFYSLMSLDACVHLRSAVFHTGLGRVKKNS